MRNSPGGRYGHSHLSDIGRVEHIPTYQELQEFLPPVDHHEYNTKRSWLTHIIMNNLAVFPDFATQMGRAVHIVDIRPSNELGKQGIIPGSNWYPRDTEDFLERIQNDFPSDTLVAVVDWNGVFSRHIAGLLRTRYGFKFSAVLAGGVRLFKTFGFSVNRSISELKKHKCEPISIRSLQSFRSMSSEDHTTIRDKGPYHSERRTLEQVARHVEGDLLQWIKMGAFTVHGRVSCIDGRGGNGCIGTPGGDMGEMILILSTYEHLTGCDLTLPQTRYLFQHRLDTFGRFYLHTDEKNALDALNFIKKNIIQDEKIIDEIEKELIENEVLPENLLREFIHLTPDYCHDNIINYMISPECIGCGHLKLMLTKGEQYKVRPNLIKNLLRTFYELSFWDETSDCDYVVLSGSHEECGVLSIEMHNEIKPYTKVPLIAPSIPISNGNKQMFVSHPTIMTFLRKQQCEWLLEAIESANENAIEELKQIQLAFSISSSSSSSSSEKTTTTSAEKATTAANTGSIQHQTPHSTPQSSSSSSLIGFSSASSSNTPFASSSSTTNSTAASFIPVIKNPADIITFVTLSKNARKAFNPLVDLSADQHTAISLGYLAAALPIYRLVFDAEHSRCKVDFIGFVESLTTPITTGTTPSASYSSNQLLTLTEQSGIGGISKKDRGFGTDLNAIDESSPPVVGYSTENITTDLINFKNNDENTSSSSALAQNAPNIYTSVENIDKNSLILNNGIIDGSSSTGGSIPVTTIGMNDSCMASVAIPSLSQNNLSPLPQPSVNSVENNVQTPLQTTTTTTTTAVAPTVNTAQNLVKNLSQLSLSEVQTSSSSLQPLSSPLSPTVQINTSFASSSFSSSSHHFQNNNFPDTPSHTHQFARLSLHGDDTVCHADHHGMVIRSPFPLAPGASPLPRNAQRNSLIGSPALLVSSPSFSNLNQDTVGFTVTADLHLPSEVHHYHGDDSSTEEDDDNNENP